MAVNEILAARFNAILEKLLSMKGGAPSPILSPEIIPTIVIESDRPEFAFLGGGRLCMGGVFRAATAANFPTGVLTNPANSGVIATVESVFTWNASRLDFYSLNVVTPATAFGDTAGTRFFRDSRSVNAAAGAVPVCTVAAGIAAASSFSGFRYISGLGAHAVGSFPQPFPMAHVLAPDSKLEVNFQLANSDVHYSFVWRERPVDPSELR